MSKAIERIVIGYGSESGNARALAEQLRAAPALQAYAPQAMPLNEVSPPTLGADEALLIVSSSFGDGEPPGNAEDFLTRVSESVALPRLRYAIFGLGDTAYPHFCGFTRQLDQQLQARQARPIVNRVDADASYAQFFSRWLPVVDQVLQGDAQAGLALQLRVTAYGEQDAFAAPVLERRQLNQDAPGAFHVRLDTRGSGMLWRAGDTLHVLPENDPALLEQLAQWYGQSEAIESLRSKELRQLGKPVLRELARLAGSDRLKGLLKVSQREALEDYLWGADVLDVLQDFCSPHSVPLQTLAGLLSPCLPRAYSIASDGEAGCVDLCIRDVVYERNGRVRRGTATRWLLQHPGPVRVYCRSNPGFHLGGAADAPLILIGTGTGIAPLMGLLREMQTSGQRRETCLVFGEKHGDRDFLYEDELAAMQAQGVLGRLICAFSRDGQDKYYVQHAMADHAGHLCDLLARGAHLYVCGNKRHLEKAVRKRIEALLGDSTPHEEGGGEGHESAWQRLQREGRIHLELY